MKGLTAAATLAASLIAPARPAASGQVSAEYLDLLERYARGERAVAVAGLARFPERDAEALQAWALAAERCPECQTAVELSRVRLRAAVMLHADRDEADRPEWSGTEQLRRCPGRHAWLAGRYAALLARRPETRDFARSFFLAMALRCQWSFCLDDAQRWARDGLKLFPRDGLLLLAAGSAAEEGATLTEAPSTAEIVGLSPRHRAEVEAASAARERWFRTARRFFEDALAADADLGLARVRLGRVLWRLGEAEAARHALEQACRRTADPALLYLAHLFLGRVHEDAGRLDEAVLEYRLALALDPKGQAAAVALSHALHLAGDGERARQVLSQALAAGGRHRRDAYWDYLMMNAVHVEDLFDALRREALE